MNELLIAFLRARLDAWDRRTTEACRSTGESDEESATWGWVRADRADIDSKRRIIDEVVPQVDALDDRIEGEWGTTGSEGPHDESRLLLQLLALPYAEHPDYRQEWKP